MQYGPLLVWAFSGACWGHQCWSPGSSEGGRCASSWTGRHSFSRSPWKLRPILLSKLTDGLVSSSHCYRAPCRLLWFEGRAWTDGLTIPRARFCWKSTAELIYPCAVSSCCKLFWCNVSRSACKIYPWVQYVLNLRFVAASFLIAYFFVVSRTCALWRYQSQQYSHLSFRHSRDVTWHPLNDTNFTSWWNQIWIFQG